MNLRRKLRNARIRYAQGGVAGLYRAIRERLPEESPWQAIYRRVSPVKYKESHELAFWKDFRATHGTNNSWYPQWFTTNFGLTVEWYAGQRILDIGCGPLGSLEWATDALERVGLDPLAREYQQLGASRHQMQYVAAPSERIPFGNGHFDLVSSFNSLDHVADVPQTIREIIRVLRSGGLFLLMTDVNHRPTPTEPQTFGWQIANAFQPALQLLERHEYERSPDGLYQSIEANVPFNHADTTERMGVLKAKFRKP